MAQQTDHVRQIAERYFIDHDLEALAPDIRYENKATREVMNSREEVAEMLEQFYSEAFEGEAETTHTSYADDGTAVSEFTWRGKHVGEFADIDPTGREVEMDCCLTVSVGDDYIEEANLYAPLNLILEQLAEPK